MNDENKIKASLQKLEGKIASLCKGTKDFYLDIESLQSDIYSLHNDATSIYYEIKQLNKMLGFIDDEEKTVRIISKMVNES